MSRKRTPPQDLEPGPELNAGLFHERTVVEVAQVRETLRQVLAAEGERDDETRDLIVECLEELADYCIDRDILTRTSIGKEIGALRKHAEPSISERAAALVAHWKADMAIRDLVVENFTEKIGLPKRQAKELEEGLFNVATPLGFLVGDGYSSYQKHYKRLCTHFRTKGPGSLLARIQPGGDVQAGGVAALPDVELLSTEQRQRQKDDQKAGLKAAIMEQEPEGTLTSEYMCPSCNSVRTTYKEVQTGWHNDQQDMTILVQCLDCGNRFKASDDHGLSGS